MASKIGKILVVDDNLGIRRALEILLPVHFAEVKTIPSPATLVSSLEQFRPDVVLLDMNFNTSINTGNEGLYWAGEIKKLAPGVAGRMTTLLDDENTPANVKVRIMEIILERTYGKPEAAIKLKAEVRSGEAARARLEAIAARIRLEVDQDAGD